uniref:Uncharacterized protein n=1 Tax=Nothobranchius furzeri TaxID=105023 RepID=A0A8C6LTF9_NOTFU
MASLFKIMSLNVNGLKDPTKRHKVMKKIQNERNYRLMNVLYYSSFPKQGRRGVPTLLLHTWGCYNMIRGKLENNYMTILNVYTPPESTKPFYKHRFDLINMDARGVLIRGGDLNLIRNQRLDSTSFKRNRITLKKIFNYSLEESGLVDVWRNIHKYIKNTHWCHSPT